MRTQVTVELLLVPECPHASAARTLLAHCLFEVQLDAAVVERVGDFPSPTILVDGRDVMTGDAVTSGVAACRLDLPTAPQVRRALHHALRPADANPQTAGPQVSAEGCPAQLAVGVTRDRLTAVTPPARALHRAVLRGFAASGAAPDPVALAVAVPGRHVVGDLLAELHEHDVIRLDEHGGVRVAYPFSGVPTAHTVRIGRGPTVYAMCAIDALGMAEMLGRDVTVTSTDPTDDGEIRVEIRGRVAVWTPKTAVVVVGSTTPASADGGCCPPRESVADVAPAAERCCAAMNFFTSTGSARRWLDAHRDVTGVILGQSQALRLGAGIFGRLLEA